MQRGLKIPHRLLGRGKLNREQPAIPFTAHQCPAVQREFTGKVLAVAGANDLRARPVSEHKRWKTD
jgi:hypothetical protein